MEYNMHLNDRPFNRMKNGTKTIEFRVNDEKRQLLKENDFIEFINRLTLEKIIVQVERIYKYPTFDEGYKHFDKISMGYDEDDIVNPKDMEQYYSKEEQDKYGVIGIKVKLVEDRNAK